MLVNILYPCEQDHRQKGINGKQCTFVTQKHIRNTFSKQEYYKRKNRKDTYKDYYRTLDQHSNSFVVPECHVLCSQFAYRYSYT